MVPARLVGLNGMLITRTLSALMLLGPVVSTAQERPRARDLGVVVGTLKTGPANAITDVPGVAVGHRTVAAGDSINTGITAILPHGGNLFLDRVPASIHVINGFGKLLGIAQVQELGELETPILLTCTLCVWRAADALAAHLLARRAVFGLARTGASGSSGSGDFVIAFSTAESMRRRAGGRPRPTDSATEVSGDRLNTLFQAVADATEEAIYNSLFRAAPVTYRGRTTEALPIEQTLEILDKYGARRRMAR